MATAARWFKNEQTKTKEASKTETNKSGEGINLTALVWAFAMIIVIAAAAILIAGKSAKASAARTIRTSVDPYVIKESDAAVRENNYFVRTSSGEAVVFDLNLYLTDHGARDIKFNTDYDSGTRIFQATYSFKLGEAEMAVVSYSQSGDNGSLHYRYSDIVIDYPQRLASVSGQHVRAYTANSEIKHDNNYVVYEKTEALKFDRAALGQLCYFIQNGYCSYSNLTDEARTELQTIGFVFATN